MALDMGPLEVTAPKKPGISENAGLLLMAAIDLFRREGPLRLTVPENLASAQIREIGVDLRGAKPVR